MINGTRLATPYTSPIDFDAVRRRSPVFPLNPSYYILCNEISSLGRQGHPPPGLRATVHPPLTTRHPSPPRRDAVLFDVIGYYLAFTPL
jgi:hypothetical protein